MNHGLFGKLEVGDLQDFEDLSQIAKLVEENTRGGQLIK